MSVLDAKAFEHGVSLDEVNWWHLEISFLFALSQSLYIGPIFRCKRNYSYSNLSLFLWLMSFINLFYEFDLVINRIILFLMNYRSFVCLRLCFMNFSVLLIVFKVKCMMYHVCYQSASVFISADIWCKICYITRTYSDLIRSPSLNGCKRRTKNINRYTFPSPFLLCKHSI